MPRKSTAQPTASPAAELTATLIEEARGFAAEATRHMQSACSAALMVGIRLMYIHQSSISNGGNGSAGSGFQQALGSLGVARRTAYRWLNASAHVLARHFDLAEDQQYDLPKPGSAAWKKAEKVLTDAAAGMTLNRLQLGAGSQGETHRLDELITRAEDGDLAAEEALDKVEKGELTLVQAIRAAAGAAATKGRARKEAVYLDLDGTNGRPRGLFFKSVVTLSNTFARWSEAPEPARRLAREAWRELVAHLPAELR